MTTGFFVGGFATAVVPYNYTQATAPVLSNFSSFISPYQGQGKSPLAENPVLRGSGAYYGKVICGPDFWDRTILSPGQSYEITIAAGNGDSSAQQIAEVEFRIGDGQANSGAGSFTSVKSYMQSASQSTVAKGFRAIIQAPSNAYDSYADLWVYVRPVRGFERRLGPYRFKFKATQRLAVFVSNKNLTSDSLIDSANALALAAASSPVSIMPTTAVAVATGTAGAQTYTNAVGRITSVVPGSTNITAPANSVNNVALTPFGCIQAAIQYAGSKNIDLVLLDETTGTNSRVVNRNIGAIGTLTTSTSGSVTTCTMSKKNPYPMTVGSTVAVGLGSATQMLTITAVQSPYKFTATPQAGYTDVTAVSWFYTRVENYPTVYIENRDFSTTTTRNYTGYQIPLYPNYSNTQLALNIDPVEVFPQHGGRVCTTRDTAAGCDNYSGSSSYLFPSSRVVINNTDWLMCDSSKGTVIQLFDSPGRYGNSIAKILMMQNCNFIWTGSDADYYLEQFGLFADSMLGASSDLDANETGVMGVRNCTGSFQATANLILVVGANFFNIGNDQNFFSGQQRSTTHLQYHANQSRHYYDTFHSGKSLNIASVIRDPYNETTVLTIAPSKLPCVTTVNVTTYQFDSAGHCLGTSASTIAGMSYSSQVATVYCWFDDGNYNRPFAHRLGGYGDSTIGCNNVVFSTGRLVGTKNINTSSATPGATGLNVYGPPRSCTSYPHMFCMYLPATDGNGNPIADSQALGAAPVYERMGSFTFTTLQAQQAPQGYSQDFVIRSCAASQYVAPPFDPMENLQNPGCLGAGGNSEYYGAGAMRKGSYIWLATTPTSNTDTGLFPNNKLGIPNMKTANVAGALNAYVNGTTVTVTGTPFNKAGAVNTTITTQTTSQGTLVTCSGALPPLVYDYSGAGGTVLSDSVRMAFFWGCTVTVGGQKLRVARYINNGYTGYYYHNLACYPAPGQPVNTFYATPISANFTDVTTPTAWSYQYDGHGVFTNSVVVINGTQANVVSVSGNTFTTDIAIPVANSTTPYTFYQFLSKTTSQVYMLERYYDDYGRPLPGGPETQGLAAGDTCAVLNREHADAFQFQSQSGWRPVENMLFQACKMEGLVTQPFIISNNENQLPGAIALNTTTTAQVVGLPTLSVSYLDKTSGVFSPKTYYLNQGDFNHDMINGSPTATGLTPQALYLISCTGASSMCGHWLHACSWENGFGNVRVPVLSGNYANKSFKLYYSTHARGTASAGVCNYSYTKNPSGNGPSSALMSVAGKVGDTQITVTGSSFQQQTTWNTPSPGTPNPITTICFVGDPNVYNVTTLNAVINYGASNTTVLTLSSALTLAVPVGTEIFTKSLSDYCSLANASAVGDTTITVQNNGGSGVYFLNGDTVFFPGDPNSYLVTSTTANVDGQGRSGAAIAKASTGTVNVVMTGTSSTGLQQANPIGTLVSIVQGTTNIYMVDDQGICSGNVNSLAIGDTIQQPLPLVDGASIILGNEYNGVNAAGSPGATFAEQRYITLNQNNGNTLTLNRPSVRFAGKTMSRWMTVVGMKDILFQGYQVGTYSNTGYLPGAASATSAPLGQIADDGAVLTNVCYVNSSYGVGPYGSSLYRCQWQAVEGWHWLDSVCGAFVGHYNAINGAPYTDCFDGAALDAQNTMFSGMQDYYGTAAQSTSVNPLRTGNIGNNVTQVNVVTNEDLNPTSVCVPTNVAYNNTRFFDFYTDYNRYNTLNPVSTMLRCVPRYPWDVDGNAVAVDGTAVVGASQPLK